MRLCHCLHRGFIFVLLGTLLALGLGRTVLAAAPLNADQIKAALMTTGSEDEGFVDRTVALVNAGTLPRDLFDSCLLWARKKLHRRFQYFKQALIIRAADAGIQL
jgi:hypothetical protein